MDREAIRAFDPKRDEAVLDRAGDRLRMVTLAPEAEGADEVADLEGQEAELGGDPDLDDRLGGVVGDLFDSAQVQLYYWTGVQPYFLPLNASLISYRSISSLLMPSLARHFGTAQIGACMAPATSNTTKRRPPIMTAFRRMARRGAPFDY